MSITIYHNPSCGTSRNTLAIIKQSGEALTIVEYLEAGWTKSQLLALFQKAGLTPRDALRTTKSPAEELGLLEDGISEDVLLDAMLEHPILVNRPIVETPKGVKLCRPCEEVFPLLENPPAEFEKENGEIVRSTP